MGIVDTLKRVSASGAKTLARVSSGKGGAGGRSLGRSSSGKGGGGGLAGKSFATQSRHYMEDRLAEVIQSKVANLGQGHGVTFSFNRLLLKFHTMHEGFKKCKKVFAELTGGSGRMEQGEVQSACSVLGYSLDAETAARTFAAVDEDCSQALDSREFIVLLVMLHMLQGPEDEERVDPEILKTFDTAEEAFLCFASSSKGYIDAEELTTMMQEPGTGSLGRSPRATHPTVVSAKQRFLELDKDGDGRVTFLEFFSVLETWVEDAEEEEEAGEGGEQGT